MKKFITLLATLLTALLALAACGGAGKETVDGAARSGSPSVDASSSASPESKPTPITVGLTYIPDIQFFPFYVAEAEGYFTDEGLDVRLRHHAAQEALFGALASGEEDVVFAGGDEMMLAHAEGIPVVNWATMYHTYPVTLIVPENSPIHSAADLKGHSVGLPGPYGENYYALQAMLRLNHLTTSDVDVQYIGYTQSAALSSGKVDSIIGFSNNDVVQLEASGIKVRTVKMVDGDLPLVGVGLGSVHVNKPAFTKMLHALDRALDFAEKNPDKVLDITATKVPALSEPERRAVAKKVLEATLPLYRGGVATGAQNMATWDQMKSFFTETGLLKKDVAVSDVVVDLTK